MYTVSDYRQTGMPTLATVKTAEAGYDFAERMGFRESACVLPSKHYDAPAAESVIRFNEMMAGVRASHPNESLREQAVRARARASGCNKEHEDAAVAGALASMIPGSPDYAHRNTVSAQETT
jgi:hypothetical protein